MLIQVAKTSLAHSQVDHLPRTRPLSPVDCKTQDVVLGLSKKDIGNGFAASALSAREVTVGFKDSGEEKTNGLSPTSAEDASDCDSVEPASNESILITNPIINLIKGVLPATQEVVDYLEELNKAHLTKVSSSTAITMTETQNRIAKFFDSVTANPKQVVELYDEFFLKEDLNLSVDDLLCVLKKKPLLTVLPIVYHSLKYENKHKEVFRQYVQVMIDHYTTEKTTDPLLREAYNFLHESRSFPESSLS